MLYCDLLIDGIGIWYGCPCLNDVPIGSEAYLDFIGFLAFDDQLGSQDPDYLGLGDDGRYQLFYTADGSNWEIVPTQAIPAQQFDVDLNNQNVTLSLYTK